MEKRIKTLYIVTILAIFAFIIMQVYWLYGRYKFSLEEHEREIAHEIIYNVEDYNSLRDNQSKIWGGKDYMTFPIISLSITQSDSLEFSPKSRTKRKVSIYTYSYHRILGLDSTVSLTDEMRDMARTKIYNNDRKSNYLATDLASDSAHYDASSAKNENETWAAAHNIVSVRNKPFTVNGLDSVLNKEGIKAKITIIKADSTVWNNTIRYQGSIIKPELYVAVPFSQLEGWIVEVKYQINPLIVLPIIWQTLLVVIIITVLLIFCLALQFSTVLKFKHLDRIRNDFVSTMIHELKRPLSTLKLCVSGIESDRMMEDKEAKRELMEETRIALDNLSAYFSKLRDITFNDQQQIPLNLQNINLHELTHSVIESLTFPPEKEVTVNNNVEPNMIVSADKTHIFNILNNLMENAVKYSGPSVQIDISARLVDNEIMISVADNGIGISANDAKLIFQRFYRGKKSSGHLPGMGLGLTYVKLLVDAHGGYVSVESIEGKGSCFTITLPQ